MEYFLKLHPTTIVLLPNNQEPRVYPVGPNIYDAVRDLTDDLYTLDEPKLILLEKPYLDLSKGHQNYISIVTTQRAYGALLYQLQLHYPNVPLREFSSSSIRRHLFPNTRLSKDHMLTAVAAKYNTLEKQYSPVEELCIFDADLLMLYYNSLKRK